MAETIQEQQLNLKRSGLLAVLPFFVMTLTLFYFDGISGFILFLIASAFFSVMLVFGICHFACLKFGGYANSHSSPNPLLRRMAISGEVIFRLIWMFVCGSAWLFALMFLATRIFGFGGDGD